jgi:hypothetical protein
LIDATTQVRRFGRELSADGQVVAFESEAALVPLDSELPVDVFVHDEQP